MELTFPQSFHQPGTPSCGRRTSFWHNNMLSFCSDNILNYKCAFLHYWFILFNGIFNHHIQIPLGHFILEVFQLCLEFSFLRLKVSVFSIEILELFMEGKSSSSYKSCQIESVVVIIHELLHLNPFR
jgi:hypothetical protein